MMRPRRAMWAIGLAGAALAGCADDEAAPAGVGGAGGTGAGGTGGAPPDVAAYYACAETGFAEARPLSGPGLDPETGELVGAPQASYVAHATQIYPKADKEKDFFGLVGPVLQQLEETPGLVAYALGSDEGCGVQRTMGIWESEEAMFAFVTSGAHATAMGSTLTVSITGKTTSWTVSADEVAALDWDVARGKLDAISPSPMYE